MLILYFRYLKKINFKRFINIIKIFIGYLISIILHKPIIFSKPWGISVEPTYLCNLQCPECPTGMGLIKRNNKHFPLEHYKKLIDQVKNDTIEIQLFLQGEPFLNNQLDQYIYYSSQRKMFTTISTNDKPHKIVIFLRLFISSLLFNITFL